MTLQPPGSRFSALLLGTLLLVASSHGLWVLGVAAAASEQAPLPAPQPPVQPAPLPAPPLLPWFPPEELQRIVSPIALYPDPLLAQIVSAATFAPEIPAAARWSDDHRRLPPDAIAAAMVADRLPWQPSVQALLPFPGVLHMMASDMPWTQEVGAAFLAQPQQVMDAVQRMRRRAMQYGYLRSGPQVVSKGPFVEILRVNPAFIVVPVYDPAVVFVAPRPGFVVTGAVNFGFSVSIGAAFAPWGWRATRFVWARRTLMVNSRPWRRTWATSRARGSTVGSPAAQLSQVAAVHHGRSPQNGARPPRPAAQTLHPGQAALSHQRARNRAEEHR
jgi:hypothetical protein